MKTLVRSTLVALIMGLIAVSTYAEGDMAAEGKAKGKAKAQEMAKDGKDKAAKAKDKAKPEMVDMTVTGTVTATEVERDKKDGTKITYLRYFLEGEDGKKVPLRKARAKKGEEPAYDLDAFVDKKVVITAKGVIAGKGDKERQMPKEILTIEEAK